METQTHIATNFKQHLSEINCLETRSNKNILKIGTWECGIDTVSALPPKTHIFKFRAMQLEKYAT